MAIKLASVPAVPDLIVWAWVASPLKVAVVHVITLPAVKVKVCVVAGGVAMVSIPVGEPDTVCAIPLGLKSAPFQLAVPSATAPVPDTLMVAVLAVTANVPAPETAHAVQLIVEAPKVSVLLEAEA